MSQRIRNELPQVAGALATPTTPQQPRSALDRRIRGRSLGAVRRRRDAGFYAVQHPPLSWP